MTIGCFGKVEFFVRDESVATLDNLVWKSSAKYSTHDRHGEKGAIEYTGAEPDTLSFDAVLSKYRGFYNPMGQADRLRYYLTRGEVYPLVIGTRVYGEYRWALESMELKAKYYDRQGNVTELEVSLTFREYLRGD